VGVVAGVAGVGLGAVGVEVGVDVGVEAGVEVGVEFDAGVEEDPDPQAHSTSSRAEIRSASINLFIGSTISFAYQR
jgi:Fe-S cluster assembly iron-binding protein IscA